MKRKLGLTIAALLVGGGLIFAGVLVERYAEKKTDLAMMLPEGALLAVEADDFSGLLHAWNSSAEKQAWIAGSNYEAFSRSRLFSR